MECFLMQKLLFVGTALAVLLAIPSAAQSIPRVAIGADGGIDIANVDGTGRERLLETGATPNSVVWSRDGTQLAYVLITGAQYEIFSYDMASGESRLMTDNASNDMQPAWSPDGTRLAYVSGAAGNYDVWSVDADCAELPEGCAEHAHNLTASPGDDRSPSWSPDRAQIAFVSSRGAETDTTHSLYIMDSDGANARRITREPDQDVSAVAWSPDGTRLAYRNGGVDDIGTIEIIEGGSRRQLARGDISYSLAWSPDGTQIVYGCWRGHYYHMCVIDADCGASIAACVTRRSIYDFGDATLFSWEPGS
jgi:Tol biopolymer transport system component